MKIILPPPFEAAPKPQSFWQGFKLLLKNQLRVSWNKFRHQPKSYLVFYILFLLGILGVIVTISFMVYSSLTYLPLEAVESFLAVLFLAGLMGQIFFGITSAFASLYMSEDLELLFLAPVSLKAVFLVKSLSVISSNFLIAAQFVLIPGIFLGLYFHTGPFFYLLALLVGIGLIVIGTALALLFNLVVMRLIPPHRAKEAIGFIGALAGILIALFFQLPSMLMEEGGNNLSAWFAGNTASLKAMNYFPWGWAAQSLVAGMAGDFFTGVFWCLFLFLLGVGLFLLAFNLLEKGFRRGFIALQAGGGRRAKVRSSSNGPAKTQAGTLTGAQAKAQEKNHTKTLENIGSFQLRGTFERTASPIAQTIRAINESSPSAASPWQGMWAVAKKDLLYIKRDSREWFVFLTPLIIMAFFILRYLFSNTPGAESSLITVFIMYTIMFSGNTALMSFGREGEAEWLLNTVPLSGWPVVAGKLIAAVLPTLILMEALLVGTAKAIGLSGSMLIALSIGAIFLSFGSSAIGLYYSITSARFNPDNPQQRISPGASMFMYLVNMVFIFVLSLCLIYVFRPLEIVTLAQGLSSLSSVNPLYLLTRPLLWPSWARLAVGVPLTLAVWGAMFWGFLAATVRQSRKGLRVEIVTTKKKKEKKNKKKLQI